MACAALTILFFLASIVAIEFYKKIFIRDLQEENGRGADDADVEVCASSPSRETNKRCSACSSIPKKYYILGGISGVAAMLVGIAKEIGDAYDIWPRCSSVGCQSTWGDILADFIGVIVGEVIIFSALWLRVGFFRDASCRTLLLSRGASSNRRQQSA